MLADLYFKARQSQNFDSELRQTENLDEGQRGKNASPPSVAATHPSRQFVTSADVFRQREHFAVLSPPVKREAPQPQRPSVKQRVSDAAITAGVSIDDEPVPQSRAVANATSIAATEFVIKDDPAYESARVIPFSNSGTYNTTNSVVQRLKEIAGPHALQSTEEQFHDIASARRVAFFRTLFNAQVNKESPLLAVDGAPPCEDIFVTYRGGYAQTLDSLQALRQILE